MKYIILTFLVLTLLFPKDIHAIYNPLERNNNKYGIHIIDENGILHAASLVNSSGGDWGYVSMVLRRDDRNVQKWQNIFDRLRDVHLIPIIRVASQLQKDIWEKPTVEEIPSWINFFSQLPWVTKNRYVILFNEPNHAKEWGGTLSPEEYSEIASSFSASLKNSSQNYFTMLAGLDSSAPSSSQTMEESEFLRRMVSHQPDLFTHIDGWASHSYPNPNFSGYPLATGRGTLQSYKWESYMLRSLGVNKELPVFITETGWVHAEGTSYKASYLSADKVAEYFSESAEKVWNDSSIVALTPFLLNYQSEPFVHFSWQMPNEERFYPQFDVYRSIPKVKGEPILEMFPPTVTAIPSVTISKNDYLGIQTKNPNENNTIRSAVVGVQKFLSQLFRSLFPS